MGSAKLLDEASMAGGSFKVMYGPGFDDGGVADLSLLIDLEDSTQRRRRGDNEYFTQLKADQLPRATRGPMAHMSRRDQKVSLAQLLFSDDAENGGVSTPEDKGPSEVYMDQNVEEEDPKVLQARAERLSQARAALRLSLLLREPACASLSLTEIAKRKLALSGKAGAEDSLRCAQLAVDIASDGFWDTDEVTFEVRSCLKFDNSSYKSTERFYITFLLFFSRWKTQKFQRIMRRMLQHLDWHIHLC